MAPSPRPRTRRSPPAPLPPRPRPRGAISRGDSIFFFFFPFRAGEYSSPRDGGKAAGGGGLCQPQLRVLPPALQHRRNANTGPGPENEVGEKPRVVPRPASPSLPPAPTHSPTRRHGPRSPGGAALFCPQCRSASPPTPQQHRNHNPREKERN